VKPPEPTPEPARPDSQDEFEVCRSRRSLRVNEGFYVDLALDYSPHRHRVVALGEREHRYRVTYEGQTLIASCRVPGLDARRALLAMGITGRLEMWRPGKA
jgi:hypothetical protein